MLPFALRLKFEPYDEKATSKNTASYRVFIGGFEMIEWINLGAALGLMFFLVTSLLDVGMNGARSAGWAGFGLPAALFCLLVMYLTGGA